MRIDLPAPRKLLSALLWTVAALHLLSFGSNFVYHGLGLHHPIPAFTWITIFVNVDKEKNLPTWFSSGMLALCGLILWQVAGTVKAAGERYARHWRMLSVIFLFLSLDEITQLHELSRKIGIITAAKEAYLSWIVVAAPFVLVFALSYLKFLFHLPRRIRLLVTGGAVLFVSGAVGLEIVGAFIGRKVSDDTGPGWAYLQYLMAASAEELFEMLGVVVFMYAIGCFLHERQQAATGTATPVQRPVARHARAAVGAAAPDGTMR
ncbi:hypothetical protein [Catellatospora tritici]|uniref:hypothetical protein n=1 Tax=Catellatospora tritici TaxID=2851566 RepID=UPI001C2DC7DF|nr:hypothetical protein [Catellatospora tritici]MBV1854747.1 hypothetical protein [Catellatospora tritici]